MNEKQSLEIILKGRDPRDAWAFTERVCGVCTTVHALASVHSVENAQSGQLGFFANGYWGHSSYKLPAEANLIGVAHYLEALEWQKEIVKVHTFATLR